MLALCLTYFLIIIDSRVENAQFLMSSEEPLMHVNQMKNVAAFGDAQHRGPVWYDETSMTSADESSMISKNVEDSSSPTSELDDTTDSSGASSMETKEELLAKRVDRTCTPCPHDMLKKHTNIGIKWICGAYQRARRSFKSECMLRYRNCQDGTMFVKIYDHRCKNDTYHGKHWFYVYKV